MQEKSGLLDRIGTVGNHHANDVAALQMVLDALRQVLPDRIVHVLAIHLCNLLCLHTTIQRMEPCHTIQKRRYAHLPGGVAQNVLRRRRGTGNRATRTQHHHGGISGFQIIYKKSLHKVKSWLKIQLLVIQTVFKSL